MALPMPNVLCLKLPDVFGHGDESCGLPYEDRTHLIGNTQLAVHVSQGALNGSRRNAKSPCNCLSFKSVGKQLKYGELAAGQAQRLREVGGTVRGQSPAATEEPARGWMRRASWSSSSLKSSPVLAATNPLRISRDRLTRGFTAAEKRQFLLR